MTQVLQTAIDSIINENDLTSQMATDVLETIMSGNATDSQIASLLTGLRMKGETIDEITSFAQVMRNYATRVENPHDSLDIVGTGGDKANTFNISTTSSFVIAASGIPVTKHGNRSASSKSGSADVVESLGINLDITPEHAHDMLEEIGMTFLFSQNYHPAMKSVAKPRRELRMRTIFNILGPLVNPANANYQMMGVYDTNLTETIAHVLNNLGLKKAMVFAGDDGLDEITMTTTTQISKVENGEVTNQVFDPKKYGFNYCELSELVGGEPSENAEITRNILKGKDKGPKRDIVLANAGLSIYLVKDGYTIEDGLKDAEELIDNGKAYNKLEEMIEHSHRKQ